MVVVSDVHPGTRALATRTLSAVGTVVWTGVAWLGAMILMLTVVPTTMGTAGVSLVPGGYLIAPMSPALMRAVSTMRLAGGADASCEYGGYSCQETGKTCDASTGCCSRACLGTNSLGDCQPGTTLAYPTPSGGTACCIATEFCIIGPPIPCGPCGWGMVRCNGLGCSDDGTCDCAKGSSCGNCGTVECNGWTCDDPCPHPPGASCGGCGTYESDGATCDDPCNGCSPSINQSCGNCGSIQCNGSCGDPCACVPNVNSGCGGTCGTVQCDGSCYDPCAPTCVSYAGEGCGGGNCINGDCWSCGTYDCLGDCQLTPSCCAPWAGSSCGYCGTSQCDGSCSDSCAG